MSATVQKIKAAALAQDRERDECGIAAQRARRGAPVDSRPNAACDPERHGAEHGERQEDVTGREAADEREAERNEQQLGMRDDEGADQEGRRRRNPERSREPRSGQAEQRESGDQREARRHGGGAYVTCSGLVLLVDRLDGIDVVPDPDACHERLEELPVLAAVDDPRQFVDGPQQPVGLRRRRRVGRHLRRRDLPRRKLLSGDLGGVAGPAPGVRVPRSRPVLSRCCPLLNSRSS